VWQAAVISCINCVLPGCVSGGFLLCHRFRRSAARSALPPACFHSTQRSSQRGVTVCAAHEERRSRCANGNQARHACVAVPNYNEFPVFRRVFSLVCWSEQRETSTGRDLTSSLRLPPAARTSLAL